MRLTRFCKPLSIYLTVILSVLQIFFVTQIAQAAISASEVFSPDFNHVDFIDDPLGIAYASELGLSAGKPDASIDFHNIIVNIIKYLLSFTGVIAVSMIMAGGFKLMVAGGNAESLSFAKNHIINGVIGLIVIITSYTLVGTVVNTVESLINGQFIDKLS